MGRHRSPGRPKGSKSRVYSMRFNGMEQKLQTIGIGGQVNMTKRAAFVKAKRLHGEVLYHGKVIKRFRKWPIRW